jgi:hypothetical protein
MSQAVHSRSAGPVSCLRYASSWTTLPTFGGIAETIPMTLTETPLSDDGHTLLVRAPVNPKSAVCGIEVTS